MTLSSESRNSRLPAGALVAALLAVLVVSGACFKKGETIEKIGNYTITTGDFNEHFNSRIERLSRMAQADRKRMGHYICNPRFRHERQIASRLNPVRAYKSYRDMRMVHQVAKLDGFHDRPVVKKIVEATVLEVVTQLYIQEKMEKYVKITPKMKEERCAELRKKDPRRFGALLIDDCMALAGRVIQQELMQKNYSAVISEIKERVQVKLNPKFDKDGYLKSNVKAYQALKKAGGCVGTPTTTPAKKTDKKATK